MSILTKEIIEEREEKVEKFKKTWEDRWFDSKFISYDDNEGYMDFFKCIRTINKKNLIIRGLYQTPEGEWNVYISHMNSTLGSANGRHKHLYIAFNDAVELCKAVCVNTERYMEKIKNKKDPLADFLNVPFKIRKTEE